MAGPVPPEVMATLGDEEARAQVTRHTPGSLAIWSEEGWRDLGGGGGRWDEETAGLPRLGLFKKVPFGWELWRGQDSRRWDHK